MEVFKGNPFIDKLMVFDAESLAGLMVEHFDIVISFDKAHKAAAIAEMFKGNNKYGFGLSSCFNRHRLCAMLQKKLRTGRLSEKCLS